MLKKSLEAKEELENLVESSIPGYYIKQDKFLLRNLEILSETDIQRCKTALDRVMSKLTQELCDMETEIWESSTVSRYGNILFAEFFPAFISGRDYSIKFVPAPFFSKEHNSIMFHLISSHGGSYVSNSGKYNCSEVDTILEKSL
ncbi:unnamed protein product [Hermetia illucens]|uniref:Uncharacterized protein n=1 Tax=Hermetia illucens TaxID=343691 RepID=A0A7R8UZ40_HERIL|nr:uncharacterized protein LOC119656665 [Hermetia illucens]CAD7089779.1 unnamed protein product [Hermetia illucens]